MKNAKLNDFSFPARTKNLKRVNSHSTREDVLNVFTPNAAVKNPAKFAGRKLPLESMINALLSEGADLVVFGERGCGKSSLAYMLHNIAKGNLELLDYYELRSYLEKKGFLS
ncbi:MAG: hypothetical protein GY755_22105 [Chloroflexi bacterium]|nr:hypothetical protein [Chloroflexota bacterium]